MAKVFVADDNPHVHRMVKDTLGRAGHRVVSVHRGSDVLEALSAARPDLALLDSSLPGIDTTETCEAILGRRELDAVRLVLLAGPLDAIDEGGALPPAVYSIVQKPLSTDVLFGLIKDLSLDHWPSGDIEKGSPGTLTLDSLVSEALRDPNPGPSRSEVREQIEAIVMASVPAMIDRIADRLIETLREP